MRGHIRKRGNTWVLVVYTGRDLQTGKRQYKWFSHRTRHEAEVHQSQLLSQLHGGGVLPTTKLRVGEYLQQWLEDYAEIRNLAATTRRNYGDTMRAHLIPALGHIPLMRLSAQAIDRYLADRLRQGLSSTSVQFHYEVLREALGHAVKKGLLARNPCEMVDRPRRRRVEMRVLDEEQVRLFLGAAKKFSPNYVLYLAAITTGMRQGELLGLRWQDVDLGEGTASIQQTFYRLGREQIFKAPKTDSGHRIVTLPRVLVEELSRLREQQEQHRQVFGSAYEDHGLVFCQPDGKPLHAHNITQRDLRQVLRRAGLPRLRFHDLRHCHASLLLKLGVHPKIVQERLGHSSPAFTLHVYSHLLPGMQEEATRALEARLFGRQDPQISRD